jgi:hypothetical protein
MFSFFSTKSPDEVRLNDLEYASAGLEQFIDGMNNIRQGAKNLKKSGAKFVKKESGKTVGFPDVGHEQISEIIMHSRDVKRTIDQKINEIRQRLGKTGAIKKAHHDPVKIQMQISQSGHHRFQRDFEESRELKAVLQAEAVVLDQIVEARDIDALRKFFNNSVLCGLFGKQLFNPNEENPQVKMPLSFSNGPDYFERPDLCAIEADEEE